MSENVSGDSSSAAPHGPAPAEGVAAKGDEGSVSGAEVDDYPAAGAGGGPVVAPLSERSQGVAGAEGCRSEGSREVAVTLEGAEEEASAAAVAGDAAIRRLSRGRDAVTAEGWRLWGPRPRRRTEKGGGMSRRDDVDETDAGGARKKVGDILASAPGFLLVAHLYPQTFATARGFRQEIRCGSAPDPHRKRLCEAT